MFKLIGAALFVTATTGFGIWKASSYTERNKELQHLITALQMLETEITYSATPLPEALCRIGTRLGSRIGSFLDETGHAFAQGDGQSAAQIFNQQLSIWEKKIHLRQADLEILQTFAQTLGISDRSDQLKHIRLAINRLSQEEINARDETERLGKMWKYLGALMGLAGIIIMY